MNTMNESSGECIACSIQMKFNKIWTALIAGNDSSHQVNPLVKLKCKLLRNSQFNLKLRPPNCSFYKFRRRYSRPIACRRSTYIINYSLANVEFIFYRNTTLYYNSQELSDGDKIRRINNMLIIFGAPSKSALSLI